MTGIKIGMGDANRITVSFPYNPDYIAKIKTIESCKWHPEEISGACHQATIFWIFLLLYLGDLTSILLSKP